LTNYIPGYKFDQKFILIMVKTEKSALSGRIREIIRESGLSQKEFAQSINVTESYISKLLRDDSGMSNTTAMLIGQLYGYSKEWIVRGEGPKLCGGLHPGVSPLQKKIIVDVEQMGDAELRALLAFIETMKVYQVERA
jgi:transcriptional regulator with XRE-family HTH domain